MKPTAFRVQNYRSLEDTGWVSVDNMTCLVGRNESGKTAFMQAVEQLNPVTGDGEYVPYEEYPRRDWPAYSTAHESDPATVASGRFELEPSDREAVAEQFGDEMLDGDVVTVHRDYANNRHWEVPVADEAALAYLLETYEFDDGVREHLQTADSLGALASQTRDAVTETAGDPPRKAVSQTIGETVLADALPVFRFIGEYSVLSGTIDIEGLLERRENGTLQGGDHAFLALLSLAGLELGALREVEDWRQTTTQLEAASTTVSDAAMEYWSQSGDISIRIQRAESDDRALLDVRVENRDQGVTVEFDQRSHGFRRFFSTFCQLSALTEREDNSVVLLDEPGLNLHARAKEEFLEFLKTEIATEQTLIYTTHSPFMIDRATVNRTKLVLDDPPEGGNIVDDVALADEYTRFPLRNVFEFDLMDTLLVHPQVLVVEEKADHVFLYVLSQLLRDDGKTGLDGRWTVIPVENPDNVSTFRSLFGEEALDVAALFEAEPAWNRQERRREDTETEPVPVTVISEYTDVGDGATIEDLLSRPFYLELVNQQYAGAFTATSGVPDRLTEDALGDGPIVAELERYFESHELTEEFDRAKPALALQRNRQELVEALDKETRRNFTRLFTDLNNVLESFEGVTLRESSFFSSLFR